MLNLVDSYISGSLKKSVHDTPMSYHIKTHYLRTQGYVYFVHAIGTQRHKIGRTKSLPRRYEELKAQSPFPLKVIDYYWSPDAYSEEKHLHSLFKEWNVYGEWFEFRGLEKYISQNFQNFKIGTLPPAIRIKCSLIDSLCSKVEGANFVLRELSIAEENTDLFHLSIRDLICNSIENCENLNKIAYICAFLEQEIPDIVNCLIEQDASKNHPLKIKTAVHGSLSSFLSQIENLEVVA